MTLEVTLVLLLQKSHENLAGKNTNKKTRINRVFYKYFF